jgi:uncharacterized protein (DUF58 family)
VSLLARRAEALGARLPALLVAADRVASTVWQGAHGRRRVGQGDSFWQFRPFVAGDAASRIDWRQSARSDRHFIRETEWEAAQTVCVWRDAAPGMRWRSHQAPVQKAERAELLLLALSSLLLRGGERVRLLAVGGRSVSGRTGLGWLADALAREAEGDAPGLPPDVPVPRHARAVLIGDFLSPLDGIRDCLGRFAGTPVRGQLLQVLDPAEAVLPYEGRVRFEGLAGRGVGDTTLVPRVEQVRSQYADRLAAQQDGLAAICAAAGWGFSVHRTDHPPEAALLALYAALAPDTARQAGGGPRGNR